MCGILGIWAFREANLPSEHEFLLALNLQQHRGPDAFGIATFENVILGHRRLSIIDLDSSADQPLYSACGNYCIVFNGELYNYEEIKNALILKGHIFHTKSDTEVILTAFIEYGLDCVDEFIGMFTFAIYDLKNKIIHLVRDRLGVKPCYYFKNEEVFVFSSDIRSITAILQSYDWWEPDLNLNAVSSYFSFRYPILNDTFFNGIFELPQATHLSISHKNSTTKVYWDPVDQFNQQSFDQGEEHYLNELKTLLESSVKYRMTSDVPIGSFLSGGVDSSIITALMSEQQRDAVSTFNIGFMDEGFNENKYACMVANEYNTKHKFFEISHQDYVENISELVKIKAAPLSVPNEIALYLLSKEIKKDVTVVLSGEGADELFMGYGRIFRAIYDYERMTSDVHVHDGLQSDEFSKNMENKYGIMKFSDEFSHFYYCYPYVSEIEKREMLAENIPVELLENNIKAKLKKCFEHSKSDQYQINLSYVFERIHLQGLLQRLDNSTMAASIEARSPFLDHRLIEFAWRLPEKYKLKWRDDIKKEEYCNLNSTQISETYDIPKYILKKAYSDKLPPEILYRKKIGFPSPLSAILSTDALPFVINLLTSDEALSRNLYSRRWLEKNLVSEKIRNCDKLALKIWMLTSLELFLQHFMPSYKFRVR